MALTGFLIAGIIIFVTLVTSLKIINQYERGVKFTLGRYSSLMTPGLRIVIPFIQTYRRIDIRQTTIGLPPQEVMTKDQVNLKIDGVVFYRVVEPEKVVLNVEDLEEQLEAKASSELKEIIGNKTMKESLSDREDIAKKLRQCRKKKQGRQKHKVSLKPQRNSMKPLNYMRIATQHYVYVNSKLSK